MFPVIEPDDEDTPKSPEQTQKSDDSGYFGNLLWSPLDRLAMDLDLSPPGHSSFRDLLGDTGPAFGEEPLSLEQLLKVSISPKILQGPTW